MDKYEYRLKAEQIEKLVKKKDYKTAAKIADTIDWRRVKNLSMLYIVAEIYEELERYEDCMEILNIAYDRAPVGRMLLYKMTETATKMHNFEDAISLYREFVKLAPHDQSRYILKYQIYRERGSKIEDQIKILREYKAHEYQEKWAYELAECYAKAGMTEECVRECDELILWFSEGEYVAKAMELKMQFEPLTAAQQAQYDRMLGNSGAADIHEDDFEEQGVPTYNTDKFSTVNLQAELAANLDELLQSDSTIEIPPLTLPEPETPSKKEEVPQTEREEAEPEIRLEELTLEALPVEPEREELKEGLPTEVEEAGPEIELEELTLETPPAEPEIKLEELTLETPPAEPETQEPEDLIAPDLEAPEVEPIEKPEPEQPAGQMTIEDVLAEWENKKAETEAKIEAEAGLVKARREKVRQETAELMKLIAGDTSRLPRDVKEILDEIDEESRQKKEGSGKPEEPLPQIEPSLEEEGITLEELKLPEETKTRRPDGDSYARHKKNRVSGDTAAMNMIQELEKSLATEVSEMAVNAGHLTKEQARLFAYFTSVKGMSGQLAELFKGNVRPNRKNSSNGNLVITGKRGNGKTTLAKAMRLFLLTVRGAAEERLAYGLWRLTEEEGLEAERIVRHVPLATEVSAVHLAGIPVTDSRYAKIVDAPMLIIDDMGCEPATVKHYGTEATPVADAIFRRYDRMQLTIITSNLDDEGIEQRYGARITDRFEEMFDRISFDNESYRR